jgi:hypothetical protein
MNNPEWFAVGNVILNMPDLVHAVCQTRHTLNFVDLEADCESLGRHQRMTIAAVAANDAQAAPKGVSRIKVSRSWRKSRRIEDRSDTDSRAEDNPCGPVRGCYQTQFGALYQAPRSASVVWLCLTTSVMREVVSNCGDAISARVCA